MKKIHIITPLSRGENLELLEDSLLAAFREKQKYIRPHWWIVMDPTCTPIKESLLKRMMQTEGYSFIPAPESAVAGHGHRNGVLRLLDEDESFFYSLDDDNIIVPGFVDELIECEKDGLIVGQMNKDGSVRLEAAPENVRLNSIDTAQFAFKTKLLKGLRFDATRYDADGVFIYELFNRDQSAFKIVNKPLSYYNYLR